MLLKDSQIKTLLKMQDELNKIVHPEWHTQGYDYMRASAIESVEAIEHHGWKWWKLQKIDLPQLQMEMIDIFHFYLSRVLQQEKVNYQEAALNSMIEKYMPSNSDNISIKFDDKVYSVDEMKLLDKIDLMCGLACAKRFDFPLFFNICKEVDLTPKDIYEQYVQKNTLNIFRQKNGYKQGTYVKIWFNEEDNVHLVNIAKTLNSEDDNYAKELYNALTDLYKQVTNSNENKNHKKFTN